MPFPLVDGNVGFIPNSIIKRVPFTRGFTGYCNPQDEQLRGITKHFGTNAWNGDLMYTKRGVGTTDVDPILAIYVPTNELRMDGFGRKVFRPLASKRNPFGDR